MKRAAKTIPVAVRLDRKRYAKLERLAAATDRPKAWVVARALDAYVDDQLWQIEHIKKGLAELDAGLGIPHEKVVASIRRKIQADRRRSSKVAAE
jgi:predicted transcriptional regulator